MDDIYPKLSCFVIFFGKCQQATREDVEKAFGVLQAKWAILKQPSRALHLDRVHTILMTSIVLHIMIIVDESEEDHEDFMVDASPLVVVQRGRMPWRDYFAATMKLENANSWNNLTADLIEHL